MLRNPSEIRYEMNRIEESVHFKAYMKMRELSLSLYTFNKNYQFLKQHLESNNDMGYQLQFKFDRKNRSDPHPLQQETYRLLLNFFASSMALVEHTRNTIKGIYSNLEFQKQYQDKVDLDLKDIPVNKFVQDLRSYILHNKFPLIGIQYKTERISQFGDSENLFATTIRLTLSKKELLVSDKWTKYAKKYLKSQDDLIFLDTLIDEYYLLIEGFHLWLNKKQREMHEIQYSWLLDQWDELYDELGEAISAQSL